MKRRHSRTPRCTAGITLVELLAVAVCVAVLVLLLPEVLQGTRHYHDRRACKSNLKQLGNYLTLYVSRYGSDRHYPTTVAIGGSGAPVPAGPNGAFWSWLYRIPNRTHAVSQRPGDNSLYICRMTASQPTSTALEYTAPNFAAVWPVPAGTGPVYPGGRFSEACRGDAMVGGDLIGPPDAPNHGGTPGMPADDWNVLCFDGHVEAVVPLSFKHQVYRSQTTGVRTT
ncbi:MAG: hypothetical protein HZA54_03150 [Planctomycetes bacterium]|nr:hypothetical protein [Planctomycetota bacterium]